VRASRRLVAALAGASLLTGALVLATLARAGAASPVTLAVINGTANAGAEHVRAGSDAFPNFRSGALDNYYPLAHAHIDGSPSSEASASPADTGPLGQFAASMQQVHQPQYAVAKYPGSKGPATFGSAGGLYATAVAGPTSSSALGAFVSSGGAPAVPLPVGGPVSTAPAGLPALLAAWRAEFLTAAASARFPMTAATSAPDGVESGTATATTAIDQTTGALVVTGDAHLPAASFGAGMIKLSDVHVHVVITNAGSTPTHTISIDVGAANVAGVPVTIGRNGVSVGSTGVPGLGPTADQADAALNTALAQAGYHMTTVAPVVVDTSGEETVEAVGLKVEVDQPATAPGIPRQFLIHQLGEVFADSLAQPAGPPIVAAPPVVAGTGGSQPGSVFVPGTPGTPGLPSTPGASGGAPATAPPVAVAAPSRTIAVRTSKPRYLLLLYFLWQSILIGTVASLWWRRAELEAAQ
jgi:hypothetical protein